MKFQSNTLILFLLLIIHTFLITPINSIMYSTKLISGKLVHLRPLCSLRLNSLADSCLNYHTIQHTNPHSFFYKKISEPQLIKVGQEIANVLVPGESLLLTGDLGAGKTFLSRQIVRTILQDPHMMVTSPTYLLNNLYESSSGVQINHLDLYRLQNRPDLSFLSIPEIFKTSICLIEWPERLSERYLPSRYLTIKLTINDDEEDSRNIEIIPTNFEHSKLNLLYESLQSLKTPSL